MKHLLTTALMFFCLLATPSWSWEKVFKCGEAKTVVDGQNATIYSNPIKVEKKMLSKPKMYERIDGQWKEYCKEDGDELSYKDDSFVCLHTKKKGKLVIDLTTEEQLYIMLGDNDESFTIKWTDCDIK